MTLKKLQFVITGLVFLTASAVIMLIAPETAAAQKSIVLTSVKSKGAKDKILAREKRLGRSKPKTRGDAGCGLELKNDTRYRIDVFINGRLAGSASPNDFFKGVVNFGANSFYARTDRVSNNNFYYWGPNSFKCGTRQDEVIKLVINSRR